MKIYYKSSCCIKCCKISSKIYSGILQEAVTTTSCYSEGREDSSGVDGEIMPASVCNLVLE